jgi:formamidopyrimidine-DNA glycosylase
LLIKFEVGTLIIHLGMSGSIKVVDNDTPLEKHDHFELVFTNGKRLRLNDPRRFGAVLFSENGSHPLLDNLGVEPLEALFDNEYLYARSRKKQQNIKALIMDSKVVVGVGNIYACESLHQAGIHPEHKANSVSKKRYAVFFSFSRPYTDKVCEKYPGLPSTAEKSCKVVPPAAIERNKISLMHWVKTA